ETYVVRLQPGADADWQQDLREKEKYLDRLWAFVERLAPVHNSLKAHVLYHRLAYDRTVGVYDKSRFLAYLALPRNADYVSRNLLEREPNGRFHADLSASYEGLTRLPPVQDD